MKYFSFLLCVVLCSFGCGPEETPDDKKPAPGNNGDTKKGARKSNVTKRPQVPRLKSWDMFVDETKNRMKKEDYVKDGGAKKRHLRVSSATWKKTKSSKYPFEGMIVWTVDTKIAMGKTYADMYRSTFGLNGNKWELLKTEFQKLNNTMGSEAAYKVQTGVKPMYKRIFGLTGN
ncbi:MAG: hypothetical protein N2C12_11315 [Planctomycetales bacterium]